MVFGMIFNAVAGVVLGLIPLWIARQKQAMRYGISALVLCAIAGVLVGLVGSFPIALVLSVIAAVSSTERLKSLGEKEPEGVKDAAIFVAFVLLLIGILVIYAIQVDAL